MIQNNKIYKRTSRQLSDITKQLISAKLKDRSKPKSVCDKISASMREYWKTVSDDTNELI